MSGQHRPGKHADGFAWHKGMTSADHSHTLLHPQGFPVAHVFKGNDRRWYAYEDPGLSVTGGRYLRGMPSNGWATGGEAMAVVTGQNAIRQPLVPLCGEARGVAPNRQNRHLPGGNLGPLPSAHEAGPADQWQAPLLLCLVSARTKSQATMPTPACPA